ncbi:HNH endonuclease [Priestia endophytica]
MLAIAPTDINWFNILSSQSIPGIVNFWTPTPWNVRGLNEGDHLLFLLKSPYRKIAGYGTFKYYENMTAKRAWNKYGIGNGCNSLEELVVKATGYARIHSNNPNSYETINPEIGCIILENPVFFDEKEFFKPEDVNLNFPLQVVKIKYFDVNLDQVIKNNKLIKTSQPFKLINHNKSIRKNIQSKYRKGQSKFRNEILDAYGNKCAISGESCNEVLEAAHIQPYINEESNHIQNGICLRTDIHQLFDAGLISIDVNNMVIVSTKLSSNYYNSFNRRKIKIPINVKNRPSREALAFHLASIFRT